MEKLTSHMKPRLHLFACMLATIIALPCFGQGLDDSTEARKARIELCRQVLCRSPATVRVLLKDNRIMEVPFEDATPIVLPNGWVTILPGEEIHIVFDFKDGTLSNPLAVVQPSDSQPALSFRFSQDDATADTILSVTSTLNHTVKYDLGMMLPEGEGIRKTSSCPVLAGKSSHEHWGYPVFQFIAVRFRVLAPDREMTCE